MSEGFGKGSLHLRLIFFVGLPLLGLSAELPTVAGAPQKTQELNRSTGGRPFKLSFCRLASCVGIGP